MSTGNLPTQLTDLLTSADLSAATLLMREFVHRQANDAAIALALARMCEDAIEGGSRGCEILGRLVDVLSATAEINAILSRPCRGYIEDFAFVLRDLVTASVRRMPSGCKVVMRAMPLPVRDTAARQLSLVANELLLNAAKHAARCADGMVIGVTLFDDGRCTSLAVRNDGKAKGWRRADGSGSGIVDELAACLGGAVVRKSGRSGVLAKVVLPTLAASRGPG